MVCVGLSLTFLLSLDDSKERGRRTNAAVRARAAAWHGQFMLKHPLQAESIRKDKVELDFIADRRKITATATTEKAGISTSRRMVFWNR